VTTPGGEVPADRREVFHGRRVSVEVWEGRYREIVRHPGSCAAVPLVGDDVLLVRQMREAVGEALLEIPAGTRDVAGEEAAVCAAREVREETGHRVVRVEPLGWIYASPGFLDERVDLFLIDAEPEGPAEDGIEVVRLPFRDAVELAAGGGIRDAKSVTGLLLAARRRGLDRPG
jgi:ADP-ribose pyrophosphatase